MDRQEFTIQIPTLEDDHFIDLSSSDSLQFEEIDSALIRVVVEDKVIVCSYLNDFQLGALRNAINEYLSLHHAKCHCGYCPLCLGVTK